MATDRPNPSKKARKNAFVPISDARMQSHVFYDINKGGTGRTKFSKRSATKQMPGTSSAATIPHEAQHVDYFSCPNELHDVNDSIGHEDAPPVRKAKKVICRSYRCD